MKVFTVQINYKSGISVTAEFKSFSIEGGVWEWSTYGDKIPVRLGVDNVESVWQISEREVQEVEQ